MDWTSCCKSNKSEEKSDEYEVARMAKARNHCRLCDDYAERQRAKPVAVLCCEGACLRGEVARQAANILCHTLAPAETARICLGGAFTKESGQRDLVRKAPRLLALEGCSVNCASRMMQGVIDGLEAEVILVDRLYDFDRKLFGIEELAPAEVQAHARSVAEKIARRYGLGGNAMQPAAQGLNYQEWIEAIDAPVLLLQGNPRQVVTANRRALALFGKERHDVAGLRGGQVFNCLHAFSEEGCGKDRHCDDCKIKEAIVDTLSRAQSHKGVATILPIKGESGVNDYHLQVSTEKVGDLAMVTIGRVSPL